MDRDKDRYVSKENAQLRRAAGASTAPVIIGAVPALLGVDHVEGLRVLGSDDALDAGAHVRELPVGPRGHAALLLGGGREHAGAHGHAAQEAQHVALVVGGLLPADGVSGLAAVAVDGPDVLLHEAAARAAGVALQRQLERPGRDLPVQRARQHGQLDEEQRRRARVLVDGQAHAAPARPEQRHRRRVVGQQRPVVVLAQQRHHLAPGREHGHELEHLEDAPAAAAAVRDLGPAPVGGRPEQRPESGAVDERRHWRGRSIELWCCGAGAAQRRRSTVLLLFSEAKGALLVGIYT
uniref:Uncharacterized protein n=1 Tax=Zea mays TaxID=4577 RepID=A0A804QCG2_MAIZE